MRALATLAATFVLSFTGAAASASTYAHWDDNEPQYPRGYAFIQDMTPAEFPVYTAAIKWDQAVRLDLVYRSGGGSCGHCVPFAANLVGGAGCSGNVGVTSAGTVGVHLANVSSRVDSACASRTYNNRLELVCHEMGHAIGLNDRSAGSTSCMRTEVPLGNATDPSENDYTDLSNAYGHDV